MAGLLGVERPPHPADGLGRAQVQRLVEADPAGDRLALAAAGHQSSPFDVAAGRAGRRAGGSSARRRRRLSSWTNFRSGVKRRSMVWPSRPRRKREARFSAGDHLGRVRAAQRLDEAERVLQVRAHPHLGDGHRDAGQGRVLQVFLAQDLHQGVAHQLAGAQLALRRRVGSALVGALAIAGWVGAWRSSGSLSRRPVRTARAGRRGF